MREDMFAFQGYLNYLNLTRLYNKTFKYLLPILYLLSRVPPLSVSSFETLHFLLVMNKDK